MNVRIVAFLTAVVTGFGPAAIPVAHGLDPAATRVARGFSPALSIAEVQPPQPPSSDASKPATASIAGRVIAADTGKPLSNAQVRLLSEETRRQTFSTTDAEGRYQFTPLAAGRYHVNVTAERYLGLEYGQRRPGEIGRPIDLRDRQRFDRADVALPRTGAIEGRVLDEFGDPAPNILVQVSTLDYAAGRQRLMPVGNRAIVRPTDDRGRFRIHGLMPGFYYVTALSGAFSQQNETGGFAPTYHPGTTDVTAAKPVRVELNQDAANLTIVMVPAPMTRVSGIVVDADGRAVAEANVWLAQSDRAGRIDFTLAQGLADRSGTFAFRNVPPGRYVLQAFGRPVGGGGSIGRLPFGWAPIAAMGSDLAGLVVKVTTGAALRGRIVFEGQAPRPAPREVSVSPRPIEFESSPIAGGPPPFTMSDDWSFEVGNQFGSRVIRVNAPAAWIVTRITLNAKDLTDTPIEFGKDDVEGVEITLSDRAASVSGGVTNPDGSPASTCSVIVFAADRSRWTFPSRFIALGRPNQDGRFTIRGLPPHDYKAIALADVQGTEWQDPELLGTLWYAATPLSLGDGEQKTIALTLTVRRP